MAARLMGFAPSPGHRPKHFRSGTRMDPLPTFKNVRPLFGCRRGAHAPTLRSHFGSSATIGRALQIVNGQQQAGDGRWQGSVSRNLRAVVDNLGGATSRGALRGSKYLLCGAHIALPHHRANVAAKCGHPRRVSTDRGWPGCPQLGTFADIGISWSFGGTHTCHRIDRYNYSRHIDSDRYE